MARYAPLVLATVSVVLAAGRPALPLLRGGEGEEGAGAGPGPGCVLGGQQWADIPAVNFTAQQVLDGRLADSFYWEYRPCSPASMCNNPGFLQQKGTTDGACHARWDTLMNSSSSDESTTVLLNGNGGDAPWNTQASVTIACDPQAGTALVDDNQGKVNVVTVAPNQFNFQFHFRSGCACGKGCRTGPPPPPGCTIGQTSWYQAGTETRFTAALSLDNQPPQATYLFSANPCRPSTLCTDGADGSASGLIQMANLTSTSGNGNSGNSSSGSGATTAAPGPVCVSEWSGVSDATSDDSGLQFRLLTGSSPDWRTTATVTVKCDPTAGPSLLDANQGTVRATQAGLGNYAFAFAFRSGCACGKGCTSASCFVGPDAWYNTRQVQFSARPVFDGQPQPTPVMFAFAPCGGATLCPPDPSRYPNGGVLQILPPDNGGDCADLGRIDAARRLENGVQLNVTGDLLGLHSDSSSNINRKGNGNGNGSTEDLPLLAVINIQCDPSAVGGVEDRNQGFVHVHKGLLRQIATLNFASACACGSGCPPT